MIDGAVPRRITKLISQPQITRNRKVEIKVEDLNSTTFKQWTDSVKWLCVVIDYATVGRQEGAGQLVSTLSGVQDFIATYPHDVGAFFVVCEFNDFVDLVVANPTRDLRYLIVT